MKISPIGESSKNCPTYRNDDEPRFTEIAAVANLGICASPRSSISKRCPYRKGKLSNRRHSGMCSGLPQPAIPEKKRNVPIDKVQQEDSVCKYYVDVEMADFSTECSTETSSIMHPVGGHLRQWALPREVDKQDRLLKYCKIGEAGFYLHFEEWKKCLSEMENCKRAEIFKKLLPFILSVHDVKGAYNEKDMKLDRFELLCIKDFTSTDPPKHLKIEMENLVFSKRRPCVLDVKMGTRLFADGMSCEKKAKLKVKAQESTSLEYGIRFTGMKLTTYNNKHMRIGRDATKAVNTIQEFEKYLNLYLSGIGEDRKRDLVENFLTSLKQLLIVAKQQDIFSSFGSSLLFVYDSHPSLEGVESAKVKLIDFAHVTYHTSPTWSLGDAENVENNPNGVFATAPLSQKDLGLVRGLEVMISLLKKLKMIRVLHSTQNFFSDNKKIYP
eukprot:GHVP01068754.1.p1 GENE.GHVP01068754.1~~GHVP01068754.1.p1  ORF type:complete len:465 (-),score=67.93 GHVP01068754.1:1893-3215(-)